METRVSFYKALGWNPCGHCCCCIKNKNEFFLTVYSLYITPRWTIKTAVWFNRSKFKAFSLNSKQKGRGTSCLTQLKLLTIVLVTIKYLDVTMTKTAHHSSRHEGKARVFLTSSHLCNTRSFSMKAIRKCFRAPWTKSSNLAWLISVVSTLLQDQYYNLINCLMFLLPWEIWLMVFK